MAIRLGDGEITESKSAAAVNGSNTCNPSPHPAALAYTVAGYKLTLTDENAPKRVTLSD